MSIIYPDLDQQSIIDSKDKVIIVEAPPGTGKTVTGVLYAKAIIERGLANAQRLKPHQKILIITFSKNARAELQIEASRILTKDSLKKIEITNFHSFFRQKVWAFRRYLGLPLNLEVISSEERRESLENFIKNDATLPNLPKSDEKKKKELDSISNILEYNNPALNSPVYPKKFSKKWENNAEALKNFILDENKKGKIYFDDFGFYFYRMISEASTLLEIYREKYPVIIIDEFQDTSDLQFEIVKLLKGDPGYLLLFADELQQIYEWRGASSNRLKQAKQNYGCTPKTLNTLHRFKDMPKLKRIFEDLRVNYLGEEIKNIAYRSCSEFKIESFDSKNMAPPFGCFTALDKYIRSMQKVNYGNIGVLFYRNDYMRNTIRHFKKFFIKCKEINRGDEEHNFFRKLIRGIRDIDNNKLRVILLVCRTILGEVSNNDYKIPWDKITERYHKEKGPIKEGSYSNAEAKKIITSINKVILDRFGTISLFLITINREIAFLAKDFRFNRGMLNFYEALVSVAINNLDSTSEDIIALIESKFLQLQFTKIYRLTQGTYVLTIHQAKGKEFDHVIMPYVDARSFTDSGDFKKIFYVGVTRAKKSVTILFPEKEKSPILNQFN